MLLQLGNVQVRVQHEHGGSHRVDDAGRAKHRVRVAVKVARGKALDDTVNLLRLGLQMQLGTQVAERLVELAAAHVEMLHVVPERRRVDGLGAAEEDGDLVGGHVRRVALVKLARELVGALLFVCR